MSGAGHSRFHARRLARAVIRVVAIAATGMLELRAAAEELRLDLPVGSDAVIRLSSEAVPGTMVRLEASNDLTSWVEVGRGHDAWRAFPAPGVIGNAVRYYRAVRVPRGPQDDWKNQLVFPDDAFRAEPHYDTPRWVKFALFPEAPDRIYFQDSVRYPFHYEFATARLPGFQGMSRPAFDAVTLRRAGQRLVLGTVLFPPRTNFVEFGIQFTGLDPYTPDEVTRWFQAVRAAVHADPVAAAVYLPSYEQTASAREHSATLASRGITVASLDRWGQSNHVYSAGWALGRLKFFPAAEIDAAFTDGRLSPADILLTDGVPAETPLVAGLISLLPSTPNSHTAILAQSFGIPFVHVPDPSEQDRLRGMAGRTVVLRAIVSFDQGTVSVIDGGDGLPADLTEALLALKAPLPIQLTPKARFGAIVAPTDALTPDSIRWFGGKSANYGVLRRTIPDHCPPAVALSFDLWDDFLDQVVPGGFTLRTEIATRLSPHQTYPPNISALKTTLAGIRSLITGTADFSPAQRDAVIAAMAPFEPGRKIRFRSSTNVEDSAHFTGAGLYDSFSGCLLDDTDGDTTGPSACDPTEAQERGIFRAIRKVYASFYNDNAYLERLRHGVNESQVGMGVLVHHSFPDANELANGVATLAFRYSFGSSVEGKWVSQAGAESVTNPDGTALPEVVEVFAYNDSVDLTLRQHSSRVPIGGSVMKWTDDYRGLLALTRSVAEGWRQLQPATSQFSLDFEYKKDAALGLVIKQVRPLPVPAPASPTTAVLLDDPQDWVVAQKEAADVFANHRLKSIWRLHARPMKLTPEALAGGLYTEGSVEYVAAQELAALNGPVAQWPDASTTPDGIRQRWSTDSGLERRLWELSVPVTASVSGSTPPVVTLNDFEPMLTVTYARPMPVVDYNGTVQTTQTDIVFLEPRRAVTPGATLVQRAFVTQGGLRADTSFYWPDEPPLAGGYTAPLVRFEQTTLTGLTRDPIVLRGYYSQTYRPGHHNFTEDFIFEPALEPGIAPAVLAELQAANIRFLHVQAGFAEPVFRVLGFDGTLRRL